MGVTKMKTIFLVALFVLIPTVTFAEKWTGPTSPIDPMWGMKGSSIMSEALRSNPPQVFIPNNHPSQNDLDAAYERGKAEGKETQYETMALIELLEWLKTQPRKDR